MTRRLPTLYISHGAGPCFFMDSFPPFAPGGFDRMAGYLRGIDGSLGVKPKVVIVISAHWEEQVPTVTGGKNPPLLFDYYGFPEHTYRLIYPAPGAPELAARLHDLLAQAGIASARDDARGFDHGVFVPFLLIYPQADIPIIQLSLQKGLDPAAHLAMGRALAPLRDEGVLIVGSGFSYHNLHDFFDGSEIASQKFDAWLYETVTQSDSLVREQKLLGWEQAPAARACHPRAEHLLPLMVAAGAAEADSGQRVYSDILLGKSVSGFQFG